MTKKDFQLIADVLKRNHEAHKSSGDQIKAFLVEEMAVDFAESLKEINPRFKTNLFLKAALSQ